MRPSALTEILPSGREELSGGGAITIVGEFHSLGTFKKTCKFGTVGSSLVTFINTTHVVCASVPGSSVAGTVPFTVCYEGDAISLDIPFTYYGIFSSVPVNGTDYEGDIWHRRLRGIGR